MLHEPLWHQFISSCGRGFWVDIPLLPPSVCLQCHTPAHWKPLCGYSITCNRKKLPELAVLPIDPMQFEAQKWFWCIWSRNNDSNVRKNEQWRLGSWTPAQALARWVVLLYFFLLRFLYISIRCYSILCFWQNLVSHEYPVSRKLSCLLPANPTDVYYNQGSILVFVSKVTWAENSVETIVYIWKSYGIAKDYNIELWGLKDNRLVTYRETGRGKKRWHFEG